jgi:endonuclease YncB( thermonuclease family)
MMSAPPIGLHKKRRSMVLRRVISAAACAAVAVPAVAQIYLGSAQAVDGDSLNIGGSRFRLFGIDAVELRQTCNRKEMQWQCGEEAASALRNLVDGMTVNCNQRDKDPYGRIVATCTVNGQDIAEQMVSMGYAVALPNLSSAYIPAEKVAKSEQIGIWASDFQLPSEYRAGEPSFAMEDQALLAERKAQDRAADQQGSHQPQRAVRSSFSYRNCREARAAGAVPLYRGQPGYGAHMDGDGDGIACEPYRGRR